ncbi:MAG TPA: DinB family protein [Terriglobales bacterium]|nr:DinB family protein [Terriglobales bacterium]
MSELEFIIDQLQRSFDGEAWHGPVLMEILDGVDAATAAARPILAAHSIWELVLHIAAWERIIARRITKREAATPTDEENFPQVTHTSDSTWHQTIVNLRSAHAELIAAVSNLEESRLNEPVPGKDYDLRFMLTGAVQHAAYHGGQIALLKRARS